MLDPRKQRKNTLIRSEYFHPLIDLGIKYGLYDPVCVGGIILSGRRTRPEHVEPIKNYKELREKLDIRALVTPNEKKGCGKIKEYKLR